MTVKTQMWLYLFASLLMSCASKSIDSKKISIGDLDSIKIGDSSNRVADKIGRPGKQMTSDGLLVWIYNNPQDGYQRAAMEFDPKSNLLSAKTILLDEGDAELKLDYLLHEKFKTLHFREIRFPQCGKDFVSDEALYVDEANGVSVAFSKSQHYAMGISWSVPGLLKQDVKNILGCKKRVSN